MGVNLLDIFILILVSIIKIAIYPDFRSYSNKLAIITVVQPLLGIILFIVTHEIGRTTTYTTGLTISIILLWKDELSKNTAYLGILASVLLLIADLSFSFTYSDIMAIRMIFGYLLFIPWFFMIGLWFYQLVKDPQLSRT